MECKYTEDSMWIGWYVTKNLRYIAGTTISKLHKYVGQRNINTTM